MAKISTAIITARKLRRELGLQKALEEAERKYQEWDLVKLVLKSEVEFEKEK